MFKAENLAFLAPLRPRLPTETQVGGAGACKVVSYLFLFVRSGVLNNLFDDWLWGGGVSGGEQSLGAGLLSGFGVCSMRDLDGEVSIGRGLVGESLVCVLV
jgi:hypothetical protein